MRVKLETANFATKLRRWAGKRAYKDESTYGGSPRFEEELRNLAEEAVDNPSLLNVDLIEWLLSRSSPKANAFFFFLGNCDRLFVFRERMEALAERLDGANAFSSFWSGWAKRDRKSAEERLDQLASSNAVTGNAIILATSCLEASQSAIDRIKAQIQGGRVDPEYVGHVILTSRWMEGLTDDQFEQLLKTVAGETFNHEAAAVEMLCLWLDFGKPLQGSLADFAWQCLKHDPPVLSSSDEWHFDQLAARLAEDDPERGFRLLARFVEKPERDSNHWDPLSLFGEHQFWTVLHARDRQRLIGTLLDVARTEALKCFHITWNLRELLDQEGDKDLLLYFARVNRTNARIIAHCMTNAKTGFWPIAFELVRLYPHDEELLGSLTAGIEQPGTVIGGPLSRLYDARKQEVEQILHEPSTPPEAHGWLREVMSRLDRKISRQIIWEYDEDVNDLQGYIQDKHSSQRLWAIGRVLKYAKWEDIKRLLTVEDIEETLPQIDIPEKKRKMLEKAIEIWRYGK